MASPAVRPIHDGELGAFLAVQRTAMHMGPLDDEDVDARREVFSLDRCLGARAGDTLCGTARSFPTELRVPGGSVPAAAVSHVAVLPTHRRRGHLGRLMDAQLRDVAARGEPVAILLAAEWPIYGRYGYGPATEACSLLIDTPSATMRDPATGTTTLADAPTFGEALSDVHSRAWRRTPGHMTWDSRFVDIWAGVRDARDGEDEARRRAVKVVWRDARGRPQGVAAYHVRDEFVDNRPAGELTTSVLVAATDEAERELFRYLLSVDWVTSVRAGLRPTDDPLPHRLVDGRAAVLADRSDHLWLRVLDVPAALAARRYATTDHLVVRVHDPAGYAEGSFALDAGPDGASCAPTDAAPDIVVPVEALGAAYLGGASWGRLAAAGRVDERRPGAVARAATLFTPPRAPWCSTSF